VQSRASLTCFGNESLLLLPKRQAWILNESAFNLRAVGRLAEVLAPIRAVTEMTARLGEWENAARDDSNLSELELTLGEVSGALSDAERSGTFADRSGDAF